MADPLALLPVPGDGRDSSEHSDDGVWGRWQPGWILVQLV